ncbi:MAG: hypothetical protein U1F00_11350 [Rhodoferax sp.]
MDTRHIAEHTLSAPIDASTWDAEQAEQAPVAQYSDTGTRGSGFAVRARLANGVLLSRTSAPATASAQANLLHTLARLPSFD